VSAYEIRLSGCDDSNAFVTELTEAEAGLLRQIAALSRESSDYECQPTMTISPPADQEVTS
jgi:hypothetical protein